MSRSHHRRHAGALALMVVLCLALAGPAEARKPIVAYVDSATGAFSLYDTETAAPVATPPVPAGVTRFGMSHDGRYVAYSHPTTKAIHLYDRQAAGEVPLPGIGVSANPGSLAVSNTGLIAFDDNGNGPARVYDSGAGTFLSTGLDPANGHRQTKLSGDGRFLVTTCLSSCVEDRGSDGAVYVQDLVLGTDVAFPDDIAVAGEPSENRPCVDADGSLVGFDVFAGAAASNNVYLYDRGLSALVPIAGLQTAAAERDCALDIDGSYVGIMDNDGNVKVYDRGASAFLTLPAGTQNLATSLWLTQPLAVTPDTRILTGPTGSVANTSATFTFDSPNVAGATFSCTLDGVVEDPCSSPKTYNGLSAARHTFTVTAEDGGLSDPSPAARTWTVDLAAPDTTITEGPEGNTTESSPSFSFTSNEPGATFECRIDAAAFAPCTSPASFQVATGSHTLFVRATDLAGNVDPIPAQRTFKVCEGSRRIDAVVVIADCIEPRGDGTLLATGDTRFEGGTRIVTEGTSSGAPLVLDPDEHLITLLPDGGVPRQGVLMAGTRRVARGPLSVQTQGATSETTQVSGLAEVTGGPTVEGLNFHLGGFPVGVLQDVYLVPENKNGGVLMRPTLKIGFALVDSSGGELTVGVKVEDEITVDVWVRPDGRRKLIGGVIDLAPVKIPNTPLTLGNFRLAYDGINDIWAGRASVGSKNFTAGGGVVVKQGKLDALEIIYQGRSNICPKCKIPEPPGDPPGPPPEPGSVGCQPGQIPPGPDDPCPEPIPEEQLAEQGTPPPRLFDADVGPIIELHYIRVAAQNLANLSYVEPAPTGSGLAAGATQAACFVVPGGCPPRPKIVGEAIILGLGRRIIGNVTFEYRFDGEAFMNGTVATVPLFGADFPPPAGTEEDFESTLDVVQHGIDIAEASIHYTPPRLFTVRGYIVISAFMKGTFGFGVNTPHFTGEGSMEVIVPQGAPLFGGRTIGGAYALISDKAGAAKVTVKVCAPRWLGGGCASKSLSMAYIWNTGSFKFNVDLDDYATVDIATAAAAGGGGVRVPRGWEEALIRVRSRTGVPNVRLTSPRVRGRRVVLSTADARRAAQRRGTLVGVDAEKHEASFLVVSPPGGRWRVTRLGGPKVSSVRLARPRPPSTAVDLRPAQGGALPERTLSSGESLPLRWTMPGAPGGTTVDLYADTDDRGADGQLIAAGLPASGQATWTLAGFPTGRWWPYAVISRDGIPVEARYWPAPVTVVSAGAPPAPAPVTAEPAPDGANVTWGPSAGAVAYTLTAEPVPASAGVPIELALPGDVTASALALPAGLRYRVTVQAVDADLRRSAPSAPVEVGVRGPAEPPPWIAGEPNAAAQAGVPWAFAPETGDLDGQRVAVRVAGGPAGMRVVDGVVQWTPTSRQLGRQLFTLAATDARGATSERSFEVLVSAADVVPPALGGALGVSPARVRTTRRTVLTITGRSLDRRTRVFLDGRRLRRVRAIGPETLTVPVRCLRRGAHTISVRRADGTREQLPRAVVATGRSCRARRG